MKILIVEDDNSSAMILQEQLRKHGYAVKVASSGKIAWNILLSEDIHLVISDWLMPDVDGLELCGRIRRRPGEYTYFILYSICSPSDENLESAMKVGVDDFINKSDSSQTLWIRIKMAERILDYTQKLSRLEAVIPSCVYCHRVKTLNKWDTLEEYVNRKTGSVFSPMVCPDCCARLEKKEKVET